MLAQITMSARGRADDEEIMQKAVTEGVHHIGFTVSNLEASAAFFTSLLGWREVRRDERYPAIFVSDGNLMITLWNVHADSPTMFDKNANVGLHHVALKVASEQALNEVFHVMESNGIEIEFAPELLREGPAKHMMCYEPSGIRVEFIWPGGMLK